MSLTKADTQVSLRTEYSRWSCTMRAPAERSFVRPMPVTPNKRSLGLDSGTDTRPSPRRSCCVAN
eukprot:1938808-Pleurochrysis_carterae.AAC.1